LSEQHDEFLRMME